MDSGSTSTSRFRFRDHDGRVADDYSSLESDASADSLSLSGDELEEHELQSMAAKGVQHLCSELLELKHESNEDFQKNIFSNYSAFLAILKEIDVLQNELLGLKHQAFSQKKLIKDISDGISLQVLSEDTIGSMLEEPLDAEPSSPSILEKHTENVSDILDTLLSEHRLDDALVLLEMESEFIQNFLSGESVSSDELMSYNSSVSERRAMLADQLTLTAKHPRISAPELQKALLGLCQLGEHHPATQLMLQYYHARIASGIHDLQSSKEFPDTLYIQELARIVCSTISQAVRSFVALNGKNYPYTPELIQWASEETEILASCVCKYIESISEISGRLSTAIDAVQIATSYCALLENQEMFLQSSLMDHIHPCIEEVLRNHIGHLSRVVGILASADTWVLGRYYVSGILTGRNDAIIDQQPEYFFLTNSGRKFVTLFQQVTEEISPLIALKMESSVLKALMDLFTSYIVILERVLTGDTDAIEKDGLQIHLPESSSQGVSLLASLSTLMQFTSSIIRNIFKGIHQMDFEIDNYLLFVQDVYRRLKACCLEQFVSNIFSTNVDHESGPEICISLEDDSRFHDMVPSVPYLELYLELKKLQQLAEDDCIDVNWLINLLKEVTDTTFEWISNKSEIYTTNKENLSEHRTEFMQFILDVQFLVEIARCGGYLSDSAMNASSDIVSRVETSFIAAGLDPPRYSNDDEWAASAATRALQKLQEIHTKEGSQNTSTVGYEPCKNTPTVHTDVPEGNDTISVETVQNPVTVDVESATNENTKESKTEHSLTEDENLEEQSGLYLTDLYRTAEREG